MTVAIIALTIFLCIVLIPLALQKLFGNAQMRQRMSHLGVSAGLTRVIGLLELAGVAGLLLGLLWWPIGLLAAVAVTALLIAAVAYHLRAKDDGKVIMVPLFFAFASAALALLHVLKH
ncbi:DoxX family protein [Micromonospora sp. NBS 11-29]|uniref:DoxX family protein n=1 Tax=Micromonospora sp. NBS 11-29 TaxID=1960879 RepID=UPI000B784495|nr:DoxX family protein [Micromonospora sp. NBS 11-29]